MNFTIMLAFMIGLLSQTVHANSIDFNDLEKLKQQKGFCHLQIKLVEQSKKQCTGSVMFDCLSQTVASPDEEKVVAKINVANTDEKLICANNRELYKKILGELVINFEKSGFEVISCQPSGRYMKVMWDRCFLKKSVNKPEELAASSDS